jgi:hypothetical protein
VVKKLEWTTDVVPRCVTGVFLQTSYTYQKQNYVSFLVPVHMFCCHVRNFTSVVTKDFSLVSFIPKLQTTAYLSASLNACSF